MKRMSESYASYYEIKGIDGLNNTVSPETLLMILDGKGNVIYSALPKYIDQDFEDEDEILQIKDEASVMPLKKGFETILLLSGEEDNDWYHRLEYKLRKIVLKKRWWSILPLIDNDMVEIYTYPTKNGNWIRVGRSSENREEHVAKIRNIAFMVIGPFIFLGFLLSLFLAHGILSPVKNMSNTIRRIKGGENNLRIHISERDDEVDALGREFNTLLDNNEKLIENLKSTIDNVAHDLRTPLARARASAEYAISHAVDIDTLKEALLDGMESSEKILNLLNAIMDISEAETQTMKLRKEKINTFDFIKGLVDLYQYTAEEKKILIITEVDHDAVLWGDSIRLSQAVSNLLDNAIKYSPEQTEIIVQVKKLVNEVQITIQDQGPGINQKNIERIWDRLYRGDQSRSTSGLGIGLSVVKAIIMAHQGTVRVVSDPGRGSSFILTLPNCNLAEREA